MRMVELSRAVWGIALLAATRPLLRTMRTAADTPAVVTARVLGARQVLQALVTTVRPSRTIRLVGAGADALHALTAIGLAAGSRPRRVPGLVETGLAAAWIAPVLMSRPVSSARPIAAPRSSGRVRGRAGPRHRCRRVPASAR